jgi:hypothetical protein
MVLDVDMFRTLAELSVPAKSSAPLESIWMGTIPGDRHIILRDFNLYHPMWGGREIVHQHAWADILLDIMAENNLMLTTLQGIRTWSKNTSKSTIDLTLISANLGDYLGHYKAREELDTQSDHWYDATVQ